MGNKIEDLIKEAERELKMRESVYPRWVQYGKIKEETAQKRIELQKEIVNKLLTLKAKEGQQLNFIGGDYPG